MPELRQGGRAELLVRTGAPDAEIEASFAGWLRDHGRGGEGRELLAPIHAWFIEAKALLDELA